MLKNKTEIFSKALNFILPPVCLSCQTPVVYMGTLCGKCWQQFDILEQPLCPILGSPLASSSQQGLSLPSAFVEGRHYDRIFSLFLYDGLVRHLIQSFKFGDRVDLAIWFANMLLYFAKRSMPDLLARDLLIIPVPLHKSRLGKRFFNQSAELARNFAKLSGQNYEAGLLYRRRATVAQMGLSRFERLKNLKSAFVVKSDAKQQIKGKNILLIDDVFTTGSTLEACARPLKQAGAAQITAFTLSRVL